MTYEPSRVVVNRQRQQARSRHDVVSSALNSQSRFFVVGVGKPDASQFPVSIGIGPWSIGGGPNGVGAKGLGEFATDLGGEFILDHCRTR